MEPDAERVAIGRLTDEGALFGYLAIDDQRWYFKERVGSKVRRWSEMKRRYRLHLRDDWDEGFFESEAQPRSKRGATGNSC